MREFMMHRLGKVGTWVQILDSAILSGCRRSLGQGCSMSIAVLVFQVSRPKGWD